MLRGLDKGYIPLIVVYAIIAGLVTVAWCGSCRQARAEELPDDPLVAAVHEFRPRMSIKLASKHVEWARAAVEGTEIDVYTLLGMAFRESSLSPWKVSRRECIAGLCVRVGGTLRQPLSTSTAPFFCGVLQVRTMTWKACQKHATSTAFNYRYAALHLQGWMDDAVCRDRADDDRLTCGLLGYGGGYPLIRLWNYPYPQNVREAADALRARVAATPIARAEFEVQHRGFIGPALGAGTERRAHAIL